MRLSCTRTRERPEGPKPGEQGDMGGDGLGEEAGGLIRRGLESHGKGLDFISSVSFCHSPQWL